MPVLWESSLRPMYIRTVWVDGFRHAILSHDDPCLIKLKRRRPHSSASCSKPDKAGSRLSNHSDLNECLRKFNYVIRNDKILEKRKSESNEVAIEKLNLSDVEQDSDDEFILKASPQPLNEFTGGPSYESGPDMKSIRLNKTARTELKENTDLSDRVLQWLDLAGKVDLLAPENAERMSQPRHSCPELQRRNHNLTKSRTVIDIRKVDSPKTEGPKAQQTTIIDRHDFYVTTTTTNTIENYARQSRNNKITPRNDATAKTKDKKSKDIKANVVETRLKMVNERNAIQKQYVELINKKLIPNVDKKIKKQVHIFMPDVPKRNVADGSGLSESLLSQASLKTLKH
ncbi:uncharacterized protein LOC119628792 [Bombyx mori]|uniref:Uncharacterized protein n=1 Tax=Bombyx mori TaxID=7091 RepID=A0A8R2LWR6_BOMMO|nr:uncharacterized protein LOC119628792 [Bombyx mori]